jgi:hypothetical protein
MALVLLFSSLFLIRDSGYLTQADKNGWPQAQER